MNRRTNPTLLLPFMALLALIYPGAFNSRQATSSPSTESTILQHAAQREQETLSADGQPGTKVPDTHDANRILSEFFGPTPIGQVSAGESLIRSRYELDFLIATIPDPLDSRLPYLFDRNLASIQRAAEADGYVLDRFDLPWIEEIRKKMPIKEDGKQSETREKDTERPHPHDTSPGYILFRDPLHEHSADGSPPRALLLFLIGETPTSGIHKQAMISALDQIAWLCGRRTSSHDMISPHFDWSGPRPPEIPAPLPMACSSIKILGPSFSGSAESLDFALHAWIESRAKARPVHFRILSGTATAIPYATGAHPGCFFQFPEESSSTFASAVARDTIALNELLLYLKSQHSSVNPFRVALLTEGNTAYGSSLSKAITQGAPSPKRKPEAPAPPECPSHSIVMPVNNLPFPLHISRLRSESEKARRERQQSSQQETPNPDSSRSLPLPTEDDSGNAVDSIPSVSQLDISSSELMLSNLLSTISHEQFNYVGIAATDVRDVIFLAREIREHSPSTIIFALNADLLYAHPEANANTRGMLVITPYPLFTLNQLWISPNPATGAGTRIQFPDQGSEGVYNATRNLLNPDASLLEYGSPFDSQTSRKNYGGVTDNDKPSAVESTPPLWIVTVGRDGFWPVAIRSLETKDDPAYTLRANAFPLAPGAKRTNRGIVPQFAHAVLILWSAVCLVPALIFLARTKKFRLHWRFADRFLRRFRSRSPVGHLFTLDYADAKSFYLIGGTATLSVYAVAITAYSVSAIQSPRWGRYLFLAAMIVILFIGLAACFSLGSDIFQHARKPHVPTVRRRRLWLAAPVLVSSFLCLALAMYLAGGWIFLRLFRSGDGILTGFRAVNLSNGVSPLPPLFFISLATVTWAFCSIRRLQMIEGIASISSIPVPGSGQHTEQIRRDSSFFYSNKESYRGLGVLELQIYDLLSCPSLRFPHSSRTAVYLALVLTLFWGIYLFFYRLVYAFDSRSFYLLLGVTFLLVYAAVLAGVLRLFFLWRAVRALLQRLGRLPMRDAFSRFHREHRTMPRMNLATAPSSLTALGVSIGQARDLLNSVQELPSTQGREFTDIPGQGNGIVGKAEGCYESALDAGATGQYRASLAAQIEAQLHLNHFTRLVENVLQKSCGTSVSNPERKEPGDISPLLCSWFHFDDKEKESIAAARKAITEQGEEFIVSRTVHFLAHILPQLTNLTTYSLVCLFLMLLAVSSYPLQPKNPFAYYNWFVILAFISVALHMAFQMNRDAVLSCLNGTKPGEIHWDAEFIGRIVFLIIIPILGLLGVQFPETIGQLVRWLVPSGSGHP
jgi:hypothetical protein